MTQFPRPKQLSFPRLGFGSAPIGNLYREIPEQAAIDTIHCALAHGVTLLDTAPLYGLGLAEERLGIALSGVPRSDFTLATKIGRILSSDRSDYTYDYSYDGVMRSFEGSLKRLGLDSVEILHIHEADPATCQVDALTEAFPTLLKLREEGVIKAIGAGMNEWASLQTLVRRDFAFDCFLLAGRYTLLEQGALDFLTLCQKKGIAILAAGVYNSGILATGAISGAKYNYTSVLPDILTHAQNIESICAKYNIPLNVAALQFVAAHPAINTLVIGTESPAEIQTNLHALKVSIPKELWADLIENGLLDNRAPLSE